MMCSCFVDKACFQASANSSKMKKYSFIITTKGIVDLFIRLFTTKNFATSA